METLFEEEPHSLEAFASIFSKARTIVKLPALMGFSQHPELHGAPPWTAAAIPSLDWQDRSDHVDHLPQVHS
eukprot:12888402-Prorocentrum_lima.AAC.1